MSSMKSALAPLATVAALCAILIAPAHVAAKHRAACKPATAAAATALPREEPSVRLARAAVCLINQRRIAHGIRRLRLNHRLSRAAVWHSHDMVRRQYFSHTSGRGRDVVDRLYKSRYLKGSRTWMVGENLAWGSGVKGSPREIVRAWMHSGGHRHNMLNPRFREIGIGVRKGSPVRVGLPAATYTTTFGYRRG